MVSISNLVIRGNDAININPPSPGVDIHLTDHGSDWLWAAFSVFTLFALGHAAIFAFTSSQTHSIRKFLTLVPLFTNAILGYTYFTYASNLGWTSTPVEFQHVTTDAALGVRQIFYVKYIGWFLAWPFALLAMEVATSSIELKYDSQADLFSKLFGLFSTLIAKVLTIDIFVLGLLIGSLIPSTYKWGYFTFAATAGLFTIALLVNSVCKKLKTPETNKASMGLIGFQLILLVLYPICWGLSDGGNKIQPDSEAVFYGILDVLTFACIPAILTFLNTKEIDEGFFGRLSHFRHNEKVVETPRPSGDTAV